jgi:hypothetical protein
MRHGAELSLISVVSVRSGIQLLALVRSHELLKKKKQKKKKKKKKKKNPQTNTWKRYLIIADAHGSSNDLSDARQKQVDTLGQRGIFFGFGHVKRFERHRKLVHEDGLVNICQNGAFCSFRQIVAKLIMSPFNRFSGVVVLENLVILTVFHCLRVRHAAERTFRSFERRIHKLQQLLKKKTQSKTAKIFRAGNHQPFASGLAMMRSIVLTIRSARKINQQNTKQNKTNKPSMAFMRSSNVIQGSSASKCVYSAK